MDLFLFSLCTIQLILVFILLCLLLFKTTFGRKIKRTIHRHIPWKNYKNHSCKRIDNRNVQYIVPLEDCTYLLWQSEILLYNFQQLGIQDQLWFSILCSGNPSEHALKLQSFHSSPHQVRFYENDAPHWQEYKAICKPYGVAKILEEIPELGKLIFVMDSDILLTRPIDFDGLIEDDCIYGSDTTSYLSFNHFHQDRDVSLEEMKRFTDIVGIPMEDYQSAEKNHSIIGAQYLFKNVDSAFFYKISSNAWTMYSYASDLSNRGSQIQHWCAEMISMLLNSIQRVGVTKVKVASSLDFTWATDAIDTYDDYSICHMAGVTKDHPTIFNKQKYTSQSPWECSEADWKYMTNKNTCAYKWVEVIKEYAYKTYGICI